MRGKTSRVRVPSGDEVGWDGGRGHSHTHARARTHAHTHPTLTQECVLFVSTEIENVSFPRGK